MRLRGFSYIQATLVNLNWFDTFWTSVEQHELQISEYEVCLPACWVNIVCAPSGHGCLRRLCVNSRVVGCLQTTRLEADFTPLVKNKKQS